MGEYHIDTSVFPKEALARIDAMPPEEFDRWKSERLACLTDPLFLGNVLEMDFQEDPHRLMFQQFIQMQPLSGLALGDLSKVIKKFMILWPRGTFKTSAVIVWIILLILNYPNIRICFLTGSDDLAMDQLAKAKNYFEEPTKKFLDLFPEFCTKSRLNKKEKTTHEDGSTSLGKWHDEPAVLGNAHEFTVPCRTKKVFAQPTFCISTAKSVKSGAHFDVIFIDDLVNDQNYRSVKMLEKSFQDYLDICPMLEPTGYIVMTGTRYSYGDTYERIQDKAKEENKKLGYSVWRFSVRDCWSHGCKNCEHSSVYHDYSTNIIEPPCIKCACPGFQDNGTKGVLFPSVVLADGRTVGHTTEFLESQKVQLGEEFFANQYENNPIAAGSQTFTEELIGAQTLFHESQLPDYLKSFVFAVGDLAYIGQPGRDFSVIYICFQFEGQIFVKHCLFGNWDSGGIADATVKILKLYRPAAMFYEKFNGWEAYNTIITSAASQANVAHVPLQWIPSSQSPNAKLARIGSVKAPLQNRRLWLYAQMPGYEIMKQQLLKWPKLGRHDDFSDCLGMVVGAPTNWQATNPVKPVSGTNWLRKLHEHHDLGEGGSDYPDTGGGSGLSCG